MTTNLTEDQVSQCAATISGWFHAYVLASDLADRRDSPEYRERAQKALKEVEKTILHYATIIQGKVEEVKGGEEENTAGDPRGRG